MKITFNDKVLYFLAAWADYNRRSFSVYLAATDPENPQRWKYRNEILKYIWNKESRKKVNGSLYNLKKHNFIKKEAAGYVLTEKGKLKYARIEFNESKKKKLPAGQYLMVFYDIPEKNRLKRNIFRHILKELGFEKVQKSVWVCRFKVDEEVKKVIKDYNLECYAKALLVKKL